MPDRAFYNAFRRLDRILQDEFYGPKLARISEWSSVEERRILKLIEDNRGREARQEIVTVDQRRRDVNLQKAHEAMRRRAAENMVRQYGHRANPQTIARGVRAMTPGQLKFASQAHVEALARKAQEEPYVDEMTIGEVEGERRAINPFWYH